MDVMLSVSGIVVIVIMILLTCVLWKVTKLLLIPIQILLFLILMVIAYKLLFTPENMDKISNQVTNENIQGLVNKASDSAARFVKKAAGEQKTADNAQDAAAQTGKDASDAAKSGENSEKPAEPQKEAAPATQEKTNPEKS